MFGLTDRDIAEIKRIISAHPQVDEAILFGSRAKGNYKQGSDVDLALKGKELDNVLWQIKDKLEEETYMPYKFDVLDYNKILNKALLAEIDGYGVVLPLYL